MPGIDYYRLRQQITMSQVLDLIGFQPTWQRGSQLRGPCPLPGCGSASSRTFSVHRSRQVYRCFACRSQGNALDLWAAIHGLSLHQAALDLCQIAHLDPPWLPNSKPAPHLAPRVSFRAPPRNH